MDATTFLNANPDIRNYYYSQGWQGRSDQEILQNWVGMTGERGGRYTQAQGILNPSPGLIPRIQPVPNPPAPATPATPPANFTPPQPPNTVSTIPGSEQRANPRPFESVLGLTGLNQQQIADLRARTYGSQQAGAQPTLALQNIWGQPRNIAQSLILAGLGEQEAARYLQGTPLVMGLTPPQGGAATGPSGFQFGTGRNLPVRETLQAMESGSQTIPLMEGLASFSGQNPSQFWGEFSSFLPKGSQNPLTRLG